MLSRHGIARELRGMGADIFDIPVPVLTPTPANLNTANYGETTKMTFNLPALPGFTATNAVTSWLSNNALLAVAGGLVVFGMVAQGRRR
jgi:hypothetical protein